ncbi:MAG TPA: hypothetical protein ENI68_01000 [Gammaproteobacteria bacterium]|nr:hypothetical protein [Gammaproteobacteria bacterium]
MLDPDIPDATDADITTRLLEEHAELGTLIAATARLGGRWVLIATYGEKKFLFHDPFGLRQAFYTDPKLTGDLWVMSQPKIGADVLNLKIDDAAQAFIDSYEFRSTSEYRWPAANTPYREIRHLLPNHYLDLDSGSIHRYWPDRQLEKIDLNDAVEQLSVLFKGLIKAAAIRFDLALAVTAGLDSRLALAASKDVRDKITYITVRQWMAPDDHADITVSASLLDQLGLKHTIIKALAATTPDFSQAFKKHVFLAHDHYGKDAEAILNCIDRKKVVVTGSGAEVGRSYHDLPQEYNGKITAEYLSILEDMGSNQYAIQHLQQWMDGLGDMYNINPLDLFEWEIGSGNWLAMTQLEFDIAWKDLLTPYNCRTIMALMLAVDEKDRKGPEHVLFYEIIRNLWPEVLCEPVNPHKKPEPASLRRRIKNRIKTLAGLSD